MQPSLETLFLPLESGDVPSKGRVLFLGAAPHPFLGNLDADLWQPFKSLGVGAPVDIPDGKYALALVHLPKQVDEAKYWLALALERLEEGDTLLAAAPNDAGGARIEGWFKELGIAPTSLSKNKSRAVWGKKSGLPAIVERWKQGGAVRAADIGDGLIFQTQPGLFSWDRIDPASRLMAGHFPPALSGKVADFGCGTGFLSYRALENFPKITALTLVEADVRALSCAKMNLENVRARRPVTAFWHDATTPLPDSSLLFDHIIMNPPFHTGKKTDISLGRGFLSMASAHLRKNGALSLVANVHLPYEEILETSFRNVKQVVVENGFKILRAIK
jgi:16S rRNA (guanine1207-N2)-methyltransferase